MISAITPEMQGKWRYAASSHDLPSVLSPMWPDEQGVPGTGTLGSVQAIPALTLNAPL